MKKKQLLLNSFLALTILFAMLFRSVHSYEHLAQQLSEKKCHHTYSSKHEFTHQHHNFDHCYVCDFKVSSFVSTEIVSYQFQEFIIFSGTFFSKSGQFHQFFKGSLFALRAPPIFIG